MENCSKHINFSGKIGNEGGQPVQKLKERVGRFNTFAGSKINYKFLVDRVNIDDTTHVISRMSNPFDVKHEIPVEGETRVIYISEN